VTIADISLLTAIFAGALSFLSPCVLPLVPPYLCYMAGVSVEDFRASGDGTAMAVSARRAVLPAAFLFTLGFATVFVALGAGASTLGALLRSHAILLSQISGAVIIIMGLHFLGLLRLGVLSRELRLQGAGRPATLTGAYVMGLAFAFGWTPCIGPVLGAILSVAASRQTVDEGAILLPIRRAGSGSPRRGGRDRGGVRIAWPRSLSAPDRVSRHRRASLRAVSSRSPCASRLAT
jgi:cytochrome c-type biogenesis protein